MKINYGFISNSSTTTFICKICGSIESGMDMCLSDAEFIECERGHMFCQHHAVIPPNMDIDEETDQRDAYRYNLPKKYCPICNLTISSNDDIFAYLLKKSGLNINQINKEISDNFNDYDELMNYIKS